MKIREMDNDNRAVVFDEGRGQRHARTKNVRITRAQKKATIGVDRRFGKGKMASDTRLPKKVHLSKPVDPKSRQKKENVCAKLRGQFPSPEAVANENLFIAQQAMKDFAGRRQQTMT
jgi:hypothetical protein